MRKYDILATGELLIDFISTDFVDSFNEAVNFMRLQGGSPANLCMNMAKLGNRTKLVATVGKDDMGNYLKELVRKQGVDCESLMESVAPTTLILVTRSKGVSNFEPYRAADCEILPIQFPEAIYAEVSLFHTTCFGLSKAPAQLTILQAARRAASQGCQLSLDANYAQKIWPDQQEAQRMVAEYVSMGAIVKVSEVDWERLYDKPLRSPETVLDHFLNLGATEVCLTLGGDGCWVGTSEDKKHYLPGRKVIVKDTTGAGDAFWSGYLTAWLDGHVVVDCALAGRKMAELKLAHFGPFPDKMDKEIIYSDLAT